MRALILGGASSGKSEYAEAFAGELAAKENCGKVYLATMRNDGPEAGRRIERHRRLREGKGFITVEAPGIAAIEDFSLFPERQGDASPARPGDGL